MFVVFDHHIQDRHELAHAGDHDDLKGLADGGKPLGKLFDDRIAAHGRDRGHVQAGPDGGAAAEDGAVATHGAGAILSPRWGSWLSVIYHQRLTPPGYWPTPRWGY